jgi:hypothetical protein
VEEFSFEDALFGCFSKEIAGDFLMEASGDLSYLAVSFLAH